MTLLLQGLVGLAIALAGGGWYLLRARRDKLDAETGLTYLQMWETVIIRNEVLEAKYHTCHQQHRSLEAAAVEYGMPYDLIREALE